MGTNKRERKKANRAAKLEAERAAEARQRRFKLIRNAIILTVVIVITLVLLTSCSSDDDTKSVSAGATTVDQTDGSETPETTEAVDHTTAETAPVPAPEYGSSSCPKFDQVVDDRIDPPAPTLAFDDAFQLCIEPDRAYQATIETTEGTVVVDLDTELTPLTTNNFVSLARYGYYDGTQFFRTEAKSGIIQGGSPHTQSNVDPGPGYTIPDEGLPFTEDDYGPGTLAMARTAAPDSASAQFFFLANEGARYLGDPSQPGAGTYQVFGKVTEGLEVLEAIAALDDGSGVPSQSTSIISVTITEV
ncbi:MAG: peptidylprolyl isomerase [Aquihabitans sp.]